jgi:hypothetical protein
LPNPANRKIGAKGLKGAACRALFFYKEWVFSLSIINRIMELALTAGCCYIKLREADQMNEN